MNRIVILFLIIAFIGAILTISVLIYRNQNVVLSIQASVFLISGLNPSLVIFVWFPFTQNDQLASWIQLIGEVASTIGIIVGCITQWRSAKAAEKTSEATREVAEEVKKARQDNISEKIMNIYNSSDIGLSMKRLRQWVNENRTNKLNFAEEYEKLLKSNNTKGDQLFDDRRKVSHHFYRIYEQFKSAKMNKKSVKKLAPFESVIFLLEVIKPLDERTPPGFNEEMYTFFWKLYPKKLRSWLDENWK